MGFEGLLQREEETADPLEAKKKKTKEGRKKKKELVSFHLKTSCEP